MEEKYLPIGSVVLLKKANKMIMINGYCAVAKNLSDKVFDYRGCPYPEGIISSTGVALFNHDDIQKVEYLGYLNEESESFVKKLSEIVQR